MASPVITYTTHPNLNDPPVEFVWWWNHDTKKHRGGNGFVNAIQSAPRSGRYLLANIYAEVDGEKRLLGTANFPVKDLQTGKMLESEVARHHSKETAMTIRIKNYPTPSSIKPSSVAASIDGLFSGPPGATYGYESIGAHNLFWENPYAEFSKVYPEMASMSPPVSYTHPDLRYFRMPEWWWGSGYVIPGWRFPSFEPLTSMKRETMEECLKMAKDKANIQTPVGQMTTYELGVVLGFYLTAYAHCVPYSLEMDVLQKGLPNEYFSAARLREMGDCEDTSYEVMCMFRELVREKFDSEAELGVLQRFAMGYTCFMTLGSATAASAGTASGGNQGKIMAHMYTLLIPNEYLNGIKYNVGGRAQPSGLEVLLVEGTGCVHPLQKPGAAFPLHYMSPKGKAFMDAALKEKKLKALRRFIFSPPTPENNGVTAEFYLSVVSIISHNPTDGMFVLSNGKGEIGARLVDILNQNTQNVKMCCIPGTSSKHPKYVKDNNRTALMLGFHEPTFGIHSSQKTLPNSQLIRLVQTLPRMSGQNHDAQFYLPVLQVNTAEEMRAIKYLRSSLHKFKGSQVVEHNLGNSGAYLIRLWFK